MASTHCRAAVSGSSFSGTSSGMICMAMPLWMLRVRAVSLPSSRCPSSWNLTSFSCSPHHCCQQIDECTDASPVPTLAQQHAGARRARHAHLEAGDAAVHFKEAAELGCGV